MIPLLIIFGIFWSLRYNLPWTVRFVVRTIWGPTINMGKVDFQDGKIEVSDAEMIYNGEKIFSCPKIEAFYTKGSLMRFRLETVIAYDPRAVTVRDRKDINFAVAFKGSYDKKAEKELKNMPQTPEAIAIRQKELEIEEAKAKLKKAGAKVPIDKIIVKNGSSQYIDKSFTEIIDENIENINGYITFNKQNGMYIDATGESGDQKFRYIFNNKDERYWMHILAEDVIPKSEWIQYGYRGNDIVVSGGSIDVDMTIGSDSGLSGWVNGKDISGRYVHYDREATQVNGIVTFPGGRKVIGTAKAMILGHEESTMFTYDGNGKFIMNANINDINGIDINAYDTLREKNIDLSDMSIVAPQMHLFYDSKADPKLVMNVSSDKILYKDGLLLKDASANILRSASGQVDIKDINGILQKVDPKTQNIILENNVNIDYKYSKNAGVFDFEVFEDYTKSYLPGMKGKFKYDFSDGDQNIPLNLM